jgi:hypothetical protein
VFVALNDEAVDGGLQVYDGVEDTAFEASLCQDCEEALYGIEP